MLVSEAKEKEKKKKVILPALLKFIKISEDAAANIF